MVKFEDVIEILLKKKRDLRDEIEREFAARSEQIDELLNLAGYVEPTETVDAAPVEETVTETASEEEPASEDVTNGEFVY